MRKIVIDRPGGYSRLKIKELPLPVPQDKEVLVEVSAAGVNFADVFVRLGLYKSGKELVGWPITPGFEFSGRVMKCGPGVSGFVEGTLVFGVTLFGGYTSHICVPANQLFPISDHSKFSIDQWAAFPTVFLTAYHALFHNIVLRPGMHVLVHSAAGGVGGALLQLGKIAGCVMTGVVGSSHKMDTVEKYEPGFIIDKSKEDLWRRVEEICPQGFDVILDANGPSTLKQSYAHLAPAGKLVSYGFHSMLSVRRGVADYFKLLRQYFKVPRFNPLKMTRDNKSLIAFNLSYLFDRQELLEQSMPVLINWVEEGRIIPQPLQRFDFEHVAEAHKALESGSTVGKLILKNLK